MGAAAAIDVHAIIRFGEVGKAVHVLRCHGMTAKTKVNYLGKGVGEKTACIEWRLLRARKLMSIAVI
jgi:hypothetical protein